MINHIEIKRYAGISDSEKEGLRSQYLWARSVDYRSDPTKLTILPRTTKSSGSVVVDLIMAMDRYSTDLYSYGNAGHLYKKNSSDTWTDLRTVSSSSGNGLGYYGEDGYLYYTSDKVIGRYGRLDGTPTFSDDFLGAQGGVPLNTASLDLELSSAQYATAADSASLSITGDLTLEGYFKPETLPASGAQMVLMSKWDLNSDERSYKFDLAGVSAKFGDSGNGALTIAADTTQAPTDSACTGTAAAYSLSATNAAFATGDKILIHQTQRTNAGQWEENEIASYTAGTISLSNALTNTYTTGAQVIVIPEYSSITVNATKTWTAKAWNGTVGGILLFKCAGTVTVNGTISANAKGFRGGSGHSTTSTSGKQGEGETSTSYNSVSEAANSTGGGGGNVWTSGQGGAGSGHASAGIDGSGDGGAPNPDSGGDASADTADLTTMCFGGGGGGGAVGASAGSSGSGGVGGGAIFGYGVTITVNTGASITSNGATGGAGTGSGGGGAGGSGGSILLKGQTVTLGTTLVTATAGGQGSAVNGWSGQAGSAGRIHCDYYTSVSGTTSPTLDSTQDDGLVSTTSYQLRLSVCHTNGTAANAETLAKTLSTSPSTGQWYRWAVTWDASASLATFYVDGVSVGTSTGAVTSIYDSTALFCIGASLDASSDDENWFDGKVDDLRVFNDIRTASELEAKMDVELASSEDALVAYWEVDSALTDSSVNANTLTLVNAPVYDTADVPFASPTTRQDLDQSLDTSGNTYTTPTAISEAATARQTFVPAKDPQKSVEVLVAAKGTGDWTLTVHDAQNRLIASKTIATGDMSAGDIEFTFSSVWRPIMGATYHFHLTSTVADGTVTTTTDASLETVDFHTYYQFLVEDAYHPIIHFANKLCIGNERYLATYDASTYTPHQLTLPSGYRIRCLGTWREYLVIGCWRGSNIEDYDQGKIFFWDGTAKTYNFFIDVLQGGINSIMSGDPMYFVAGYSGDIMKFEGGRPKHLQRLPKMTDKKNVEVYPNGMTMWRKLVRVGFSGSTDSTAIEQGVYSWGSLKERIEDTLSYDYPISTGTRTGTGLSIGCIYPVGSSLFISWKDGSAYGVDEVSPSNSPYATAVYESLITDADKIWGDKNAHYLRGYFKALASGDTVKLKWKIDRASSWTAGTEVSTADAIEAREQLPNKSTRWNEFQMAVELGTTNSTSPEFYGLALEIDDLNEEKRV